MISVKVNEYLPEAEQFVDQLRELGLHATIPSPRDSRIPPQELIQTVGVGCSLPPDLVIAVLKAAFKQWPSLKYVHLSSDEDHRVPESSHYQISIGHAPALDSPPRRQPWDAEVIAGLDGNISLTSLHILLRTAYRDVDPATHVVYVGGPLDGEDHFYAGPPQDLAERVRTLTNAIYELRFVDDRYEYQYAGKK